MTQLKERFNNLVFSRDAETERNSLRLPLALSIFLALFAAAYTLLFFNFISIGEVTRDYFQYADAIFNGVLPFHTFNDMNWEYPPLSYLVMIPPRFFCNDPITYAYLYMAFITLIIIAGLWLVRSFALKFGFNAKTTMLLYVVAAVILNSYFFEKIDVVVALVALAAIYMYLSGKYTYAFVLLAFGMMVKLYPAILFPVFIVPMLASGKYKESLKQIAVFFGAVALMIIPFIIWSPDHFLNFITYHNARGLQIESLAASIVMVAEMFGLTWTYTTNSFFSFNIEGGPTHILASISFPLMAVAMLVFLVLYFLHCRGLDEDERPKTIAWASLIMLLIFIIPNKVFSAQYMDWIVLMVLPMAVCFDSGKMRVPYILLLLTMFMTCLFMADYGGICYHDPLVVLILFMRNILIVLLLLVVARDSGLWDTVKSVLKPRPKPEKEAV